MEVQLSWVACLFDIDQSACVRRLRVEAEDTGEEGADHMLRHFAISSLAVVSISAFAGQAGAADISQWPTPDAPTIVATTSPWMIRVRGLGVVPDEEASLALNGAAIAGGDVDISNSIVPELDITYFFTDNFAAELVLGTTPHNVKGAGTIAGVGKIGRAWLLPPTLTLQYHFDLANGIKPYVGAGVNYTFFYNQEAKGVFTSFDLDNSFGWALQAGVDFMIDEHWGINFDVKKIFLNADVTAVAPALGVVTGDVDIDPWLIGAGVTYRF